MADIQYGIIPDFHHKGVYELVGLPTLGELTFEGKPATVGLRFTQRDVETGNLQYKHTKPIPAGAVAPQDGFKFKTVDIDLNQSITPSVPRRSDCLPDPDPVIPTDGVYVFPITINPTPPPTVKPMPPGNAYVDGCLYEEDAEGGWSLAGGCGEWVIAIGHEVPPYVGTGTVVRFPDMRPPTTAVVDKNGELITLPSTIVFPPNPGSQPPTKTNIAPTTPTKGTRFEGPDGTVWMGTGTEWKPVRHTIPNGGADLVPFANRDPSKVTVTLPNSTNIPPGLKNYYDTDRGVPVKVDDRNSTANPVLPADLAFANFFFSGPNEFWFRYNQEFMLKIVGIRGWVRIDMAGAFTESYVPLPGQSYAQKWTTREGIKAGNLIMGGPAVYGSGLPSLNSPMIGFNQHPGAKYLFKQFGNRLVSFERKWPIPPTLPWTNKPAGQSPASPGYTYYKDTEYSMGTTPGFAIPQANGHNFGGDLTDPKRFKTTWGYDPNDQEFTVMNDPIYMHFMFWSHHVGSTQYANSSYWPVGTPESEKIFGSWQHAFIHSMGPSYFENRAMVQNGGPWEPNPPSTPTTYEFPLTATDLITGQVITRTYKVHYNSTGLNEAGKNFAVTDGWKLPKLNMQLPGGNLVCDYINGQYANCRNPTLTVMKDATQAIVVDTPEDLAAAKEKYGFPPYTPSPMGMWDHFVNERFRESEYDDIRIPTTGPNSAIGLTRTLDRHGGKVSPFENPTDNYEMEVMVSSSDPENDLTGVIISFTHEGGNHGIMVGRTNGGESYGASSSGSGVPAGAAYGIWEINNASLTLVQNNDSLIGRRFGWTGGTDGGWAASGAARFLIKRTKERVEVTTNQFGQTALDPATRITYTLPGNLSGLTEYGFYQATQPNTTFNIIRFESKADGDTPIYDLTTDPYTKWIFRGGEWIKEAGANVIEELGHPRDITNPDTGIEFRNMGTFIDRLY